MVKYNKVKFEKMISIKSFLSFIYNSCKEYGADAHRFVTCSLMTGYAKNEQCFLGKLTLHAHAVEKGIAMPNRRLHFGEANVATLIMLCEEYAQKFDTTKTMFRSSVEALFEYESIHLEANSALPNDVANGIERLHKLFPNISASQQPVVTKKEMFYRGDFAFISRNRHSVRNFIGKVDEVSLDAALAMANSAPSSCNRQQGRIHVVGRGALMEQILSIQLGNRGFGDKADKLLIVTVDVSSYNGLRERNCAFVDGGIFVMNLLYSLQYHGIAACTLNCCLERDIDRRMRALLNTEEAFVAIIAIGDCPEKTMVVQSPRMSPDEYIIKH